MCDPGLDRSYDSMRVSLTALVTPARDYVFFGCEYLEFLAQRYMKRSALFFQHKKKKKPSV